MNDIEDRIDSFELGLASAQESDTFVMVDDLAENSPSDIFSDFVAAVVLQQCYRRAMIPCLEDPTTAPITLPMIESTSMLKVSLTYSDRISAFQQLRIAEPDWHIKHNINTINLGRTVTASQASSTSVRDEFNGNFHVNHDNQFINAKDISCECCIISNQFDGANPRVYFASNGIVNMEEELRSVFLYHNQNNESGCAFSSNIDSTAAETGVQQAIGNILFDHSIYISPWHKHHPCISQVTRQQSINFEIDFGINNTNHYQHQLIECYSVGDEYIQGGITNGADTHLDMKLRFNNVVISNKENSGVDSQPETNQVDSTPPQVQRVVTCRINSGKEVQPLRFHSFHNTATQVWKADHLLASTTISSNSAIKQSLIRGIPANTTLWIPSAEILRTKILSKPEAIHPVFFAVPAVVQTAASTSAISSLTPASALKIAHLAAPATTCKAEAKVLPDMVTATAPVATAGKSTSAVLAIAIASSDRTSTAVFTGVRFDLAAFTKPPTAAPTVWKAVYIFAHATNLSQPAIKQSMPAWMTPKEVLRSKILSEPAAMPISASTKVSAVAQIIVSTSASLATFASALAVLPDRSPMAMHVLAHAAALCAAHLAAPAIASIAAVTALLDMMKAVASVAMRDETLLAIMATTIAYPSIAYMPILAGAWPILLLAFDLAAIKSPAVAPAAISTTAPTAASIGAPTSILATLSPHGNDNIISTSSQHSITQIEYATNQEVVGNQVGSTATRFHFIHMYDELCSFQFLMAQNHEPGVICNHVNVTTHKSNDVTKVGSDSGKPILGNGSRNAIITTADKIDQAVGNVLFDYDRLAPSRQIHQPNASQTTSNQIIFNHTQKETFHTKAARLTQSALESHCHPLR